MRTLEEQLKDYGEYTETRFGPVSFENAGDVVDLKERSQYRRGRAAWAFALALILVALAVGAIPILLGNQPDVADDEEPPPVHLGSLTWVEKNGSFGSLPAGGISVASSGTGYVSFSDGVSWYSPDGVDWRRDLMAPMPGRFDRFTVHGDWALGEIGSEWKIFELVNLEWVPIELGPVGLPDIQGLEWSVQPLELVRSGDVVFVRGSGFGRVAWERIYGEWSYDCEFAEKCFGGPQVIQSEDRESLLVSDPETGSDIATLSLDVDGSSVVIVDADSGDVVHKIVTRSPGEAADMIEQMLWGLAPMELRGDWVRSGDGALAYQESVISPEWIVAAEGGGFFAFRADMNPDSPNWGVQIWSSPDGLTWTDMKTPSFVDTSVTSFEAHATAVGLIAQVWSETSGHSVYVSRDGSDWHPIEVPFVDVWFGDTNFGTVAIGWRESLPIFWVTHDGEHWIELPQPPADQLVSAGGAWQGEAMADAVGDIIYYSIADQDGTRRLYVGRFED